ncbi:hypothetical protein KV565_25665 [Bacillus thuringiensis]|uniref:hypothetical protein n=1 Tax=Bacillus thuringiensis TaxID=1428 RepID=UPI001C44A74F|nr:hypothetical protein [Bacillus thuringiensis]MBV6708534.1 hypothetical protein [Bacillus thuringiensis]
MKAIMYTNLIVLFVILIGYRGIKKKQSKQFLFDLSFISVYLLLIVPLMLCLINIFLLIFISPRFWYLPMFFLLIPAVTIIVEKIIDAQSIKLTIKIREEFIPLILKEARVNDVYLKSDDIVITALKEGKKVHIKIVINVYEKGDNSMFLKKRTSDYLDEKYPYFNNKVLLTTKNNSKKKFKSDLCY